MANTGWECTCEDGYEGLYCAININECSEHQCQNDATCVDGLAEYSCNCTDGWKGNVLRPNLSPLGNDKHYIDMTRYIEFVDIYFYIYVCL